MSASGTRRISAAPVNTKRSTAGCRRYGLWNGRQARTGELREKSRRGNGSRLEKPCKTSGSTALHVILPEGQVEAAGQSRAPAARCRARCATRRGTAAAPGRRRRTRRPTRAAAPRPDRLRRSPPNRNRAVSPSETETTGTPGGERPRALVLVLVQPHPAVGVVVVEDAEVGVERHARRRARCRARGAVKLSGSGGTGRLSKSLRVAS